MSSDISSFIVSDIRSGQSYSVAVAESDSRAISAADFVSYISGGVSYTCAVIFSVDFTIECAVVCTDLCGGQSDSASFCGAHGSSDSVAVLISIV